MLPYGYTASHLSPPLWTVYCSVCVCVCVFVLQRNFTEKIKIKIIIIVLLCTCTGRAVYTIKKEKRVLIEK